MGLDQYLNARVTIPRKDWIAFIAAQTTPAEVAQNNQIEAALNDNLLGLRATVLPVPQTRSEPEVNERWTRLHQAAQMPDWFEGDIGLSMEVMYWRKANQIHGWFERHVSNGELQNVTDYEVDWDTLEQLVTDCRRVLETFTWGDGLRFSDDLTKEQLGSIEKVSTKNEALVNDLMPPTQGFFFGGNEIDDWYFRDVLDTYLGLKRVLADPWFLGQRHDVHFVYRAWW